MKAKPITTAEAQWWRANPLQGLVGLITGDTSPRCTCNTKAVRVGPYWICRNLACRVLVVS